MATPGPAQPLIPAQILHVDDDEGSLAQAREYLEGEDVGGWGHPHVESLQTFPDALALLETRRFDLVILDVRLGGYEPQETAPEEEEGVRTLEDIRQRRFVPVIFWTGLPERVRDLEGPLVRVHNKTDGPEILFGVVQELFETRLPAVNRALLRLIEDEQRRYMWNFVARHWAQLSEGADHMELAYLLARRLGRSLSGPGIESLADALGGRGPGPPAPGKINAAEVYVIPPLDGTKPGVGDLFRENTGNGADSWWLVVTPSCDLEHGKAESVVLAACDLMQRDARVQAWHGDLESGNRRRKVSDLVEQKTGGQNDRHLFLPSAPTIPDLLADFQRLRSVTPAELETMHRVASLVSPFAEAMVSRFTRYFGRVGTDDLDADAIMERLKHPASPQGAEPGNWE